MSVTEAPPNTRIRGSPAGGGELTKPDSAVGLTRRLERPNQPSLTPLPHPFVGGCNASPPAPGAFDVDDAKHPGFSHASLLCSSESEYSPAPPCDFCVFVNILDV